MSCGSSGAPSPLRTAGGEGGPPLSAPSLWTTPSVACFSPWPKRCRSHSRLRCFGITKRLGDGCTRSGEAKARTAARAPWPCLDGMSHPSGAGHVLGVSDVPLPDALLFASAWLPKELWGIHTSAARSDKPVYVNLQMIATMERQTSVLRIRGEARP